MVWSYWGARHLQEELDSFGDGLYQQLMETVPPLMGDDFDPIQLERKVHLERLIQSFAPSDYFSKKSRMRQCLEKLPPNVLADLVRTLASAMNAARPSPTFDARMEWVLRRRWSDLAFASSFLGFFDLPEHFLPSEQVHRSSVLHIDPLSPEHPELVAPAPLKPLKDYQHAVAQEALGHLDTPRNRFIIQMPTGSGKTRTTMEIIAHHLRNMDEGAIVVWLAHSRELCEQAFQCFLEVWHHLADKPLHAVRAWGDHPDPVETQESMFVVGGFQKIHSRLSKSPDTWSWLADRCSLVIVDEAHKTVAPTYKAIVRSLLASGACLVGLTATPGRTDDEETEEMADFYFHRMVGIEPPGDHSVMQMLKQRGVLARVDYVPIKVEIDFELTAYERKRLEETLDFPKGFLDKVANQHLRNIEIIERVKSSVAEGRRVLLFACNVAHSRFLTALLHFFGIDAVHVDGGTANARREDAIKGFRAGRYPVLCNYGVLTTGFDAPSVDEVFIARPTNSVVLYSQMVGRGLRGPAIGGTASCRVVDVRDNIRGFGDQDRVYTWFEDHWDN
jgi:DNA repair protein RadD